MDCCGPSEIPVFARSRANQLGRNVGTPKHRYLLCFPATSSLGRNENTHPSLHTTIHHLHHLHHAHVKNISHLPVCAINLAFWNRFTRRDGESRRPLQVCKRPQHPSVFVVVIITSRKCNMTRLPQRRTSTRTLVPAWPEPLSLLEQPPMITTSFPTVAHELRS